MVPSRTTRPQPQFLGMVGYRPAMPRLLASLAQGQSSVQPHARHPLFVLPRLTGTVLALGSQMVHYHQKCGAAKPKKGRRVAKTAWPRPLPLRTMPGTQHDDARAICADAARSSISSDASHQPKTQKPTTSSIQPAATRSRHSRSLDVKWWRRGRPWDRSSRAWHSLVPDVAGVPAGSLAASSAPNQLGGRPWTTIASGRRMGIVIETSCLSRRGRGLAKA